MRAECLNGNKEQDRTAGNVEEKVGGRDTKEQLKKRKAGKGGKIIACEMTSSKTAAALPLAK